MGLKMAASMMRIPGPKFSSSVTSKMMGSSFISKMALQIQFCRRFGQPAAKTHPHLVQEGEVTPGLMQNEFRERRFRLMEKIHREMPGSKTKNCIVIIPSSSKVYMSQDIPYPFRQNTEFLYFCGFQEPNSLLLLQSRSGQSLPEHKSVLFVPKKDPHKELWDGPRSGVQGAMELTGVDEAYNSDDLSSYLNSHLNKINNMSVWYDFTKPAHGEFHVKNISTFLRENRSYHVENPRSIFHDLRLIKSPNEIILQEKACQIAGEAFKQVMNYSSPGINEAHLYAKMDFECRVIGAEYLAYPPVVAGGNRANTIHYICNNQVVHDGEMVLMDAGCEYHGYTSDITRTWPVNGSFSDPQREIYEAVLEVQKACIDTCHPSNSLETVFTFMISQLAHQLKRLHIIPSSVSNKEAQRIVRQFCPHHVSHYLGMDVHDTDSVSRSIKLKPGMVVTVEPGLYFPADRTDIPPEFRGNGIRIEDDVLVTESTPRVLTRNCPKELDEIEKCVSGL